MLAITAYPKKIRALFFNLQKRAEATSLFSPSSFAPVTWLRSKSMSLEEYSYKIRNVSRYRVFLHKSSSRTKHNWHYNVELLINAAVLNVYFILYYHLFFLKEFAFSDVYISVNMVFECLYIFFGWERGSKLSTYATGRWMGLIWNACRCVQGEGLTRLMCTYALTLLLLMFLAAF